MIYKNVSEIYEAIDKTRSDLKRKVAVLADEQKTARSSEEKSWSVTEILEHLSMVEQGVVRLAAKLLSDAEASGAPVFDGTFAEPVSFATRADSIRDKKLSAPERVHPRGMHTIEETLAKMDENRRTLNELRPRIESIDASAPTFPHPFFGDLNLYEWLAMVAMHEARHLRQIENLLGETGKK